MTRRKPHTILAGAAVIALVALAVAGCGGDDDDGGQATAAPPKTKSGHAATIGVETSSSLGKIVADSQGKQGSLSGLDPARAGRLWTELRGRGSRRQVVGQR